MCSRRSRAHVHNKYAMFLKERRGKSTPEEKLEDSETAVGVKNQESRISFRDSDSRSNGPGARMLPVLIVLLYLGPRLQERGSAALGRFQRLATLACIAEKALRPCSYSVSSTPTCPTHI